MGRPRISVTTLGDLLDDRAETGGDADAVVFPGRGWATGRCATEPG